MLSAATVNDNTTRDSMIGLVHQFCASNQNNVPFSAYYNPSNGLVEFPDFAGNDAGGVHSQVSYHFPRLQLMPFYLDLLLGVFSRS